MATTSQVKPIQHPRMFQFTSVREMNAPTPPLFNAVSGSTFLGSALTYEGACSILLDKLEEIHESAAFESDRVHELITSGFLSTARVVGI